MCARRSDEPKHCKVYNGVGNRIVSMGSVEDGEVLYVVPQERSFVWPTIEIGRQVTVPHVTTPLGKHVTRTDRLRSCNGVFDLTALGPTSGGERASHSELPTSAFHGCMDSLAWVSAVHVWPLVLFSATVRHDSPLHFYKFSVSYPHSLDGAREAIFSRRSPYVRRTLLMSQVGR